MSKSIGVIAGIVVLAAVIILTTSGNKIEKRDAEAGIDSVAGGAQSEMSDVSQADERILVQETVSMGIGSYEAYATEKLAMAEAGDVVLFFHASWCPSCRSLNADIEKKEGAIPAGVTILKTDYDTETELKKKYGVTTQHTLVQVDKDGTMIKKWSGGSKLENLLSEIQ